MGQIYFGDLARKWVRFQSALTRLGDAHPTSSKIDEALKLAGIDSEASYLRQGEQLIHNFGYAVWCTGSLLFGEQEKCGN